MDSFYGGQPGAPFVLKATFESIDDMKTAFAQGSNYTDCYYGEYCIISCDVDNEQNGCVYRRGYGGAEYIGRFAGPRGGLPYVSIDKIDTLKAELSESADTVAEVKANDIIFPTAEGENNWADYIVDNNATAPSIYNDSLYVDEFTTDNGLVPGKTNDAIKYSWYNYKDNNKNRWTRLGLEIPYPEFDFWADYGDAAYDEVSGEAVSHSGLEVYTKNSDNLSGLDNTSFVSAALDAATRPFYNPMLLQIPRAPRGIEVSELYHKTWSDIPKITLDDDTAAIYKSSDFHYYTSVPLESNDYITLSYIPHYFLCVTVDDNTKYYYLLEAETDKGEDSSVGSASDSEATTYTTTTTASESLAKLILGSNYSSNVDYTDFILTYTDEGVSASLNGTTITDEIQYTCTKVGGLLSADEELTTNSLCLYYIQIPSYDETKSVIARTNVEINGNNEIITKRKASVNDTETLVSWKDLDGTITVEDDGSISEDNIPDITKLSNLEQTLYVYTSDDNIVYTPSTNSQSIKSATIASGNYYAIKNNNDNYYSLLKATTVNNAYSTAANYTLVTHQLQVNSPSYTGPGNSNYEIWYYILKDYSNSLANPNIYYVYAGDYKVLNDIIEYSTDNIGGHWFEKTYTNGAPEAMYLNTSAFVSHVVLKTNTVGQDSDGVSTYTTADKYLDDILNGTSTTDNYTKYEDGIIINAFLQPASYYAYDKEKSRWVLIGQMDSTQYSLDTITVSGSKFTPWDTTVASTISE